MTKHALAMLATLTLPAVACRDVPEQAGAPSPTPAYEVAQEVTEKEPPKQEALAGMDTVIEAYLQEAQRLADDEFSPDAAREVSAALAQVDVAEPPEWLAELRLAAEAYAQAGDIATARQRFSGLSTRLIAYVEAHRTDVPVHKMRCSMAPEGIQGEWLQSATEPHNPWYGKKMLNCGEVIW